MVTSSSKMGQPTKLTPPLTAKLCKYLREGTPIGVAQALCGIPSATYNEWMRRGEGKDPKRKKTELYADFALKVRKATAQGCHKRTKKIESIAESKQDWKALAFLNKVAMPEVYSDTALLSKAVETKLHNLMSNLFWLMSESAYNEMVEAIRLTSEHQLLLSEMEELKAIEILMRTNYLPRESSGQIGNAYMNFKQAVKDSLFNATQNEQNGHEVVVANAIASDED